MKRPTRIVLYILFVFLILGLWFLKISSIHYEILLSQNRALVFDQKIQELVIRYGRATWYDYGFDDDPDYSMHHLTAASLFYPKGTCLIIKRVDNDGEVVVRVNDRGPTIQEIDLSSYAFRQLAPLSMGIINVEIRKLEDHCK